MYPSTQAQNFQLTQIITMPSLSYCCFITNGLAYGLFGKEERGCLEACSVSSAYQGHIQVLGKIILSPSQWQNGEILASPMPEMHTLLSRMWEISNLPNTCCRYCVGIAPSLELGDIGEKKRPEVPPQGPRSLTCLAIPFLSTCALLGQKVTMEMIKLLKRTDCFPELSFA